jgi:myo-inositol-1(or 4)-monophosphatase
LVNVAVGRFDLFYHQALKPWDLAAALIILQEAGAVVTQNTGEPANYLQPSIIAASPQVYRQFMQALAEYRRTGNVER